MKNTALIENKKRRILSNAVLILAILLVIIAILPSCLNAVKNKNLNGNTERRVVTLKSWEFDDGEKAILTDSEGKKYNVVCDRENTVKWDEFIGDTVVLVTAKETFGKVDSWVLGIEIDGSVVKDYNETLINLREENKNITTGSLIALGAVAAVMCVLIVVKINLPKFKEVPLIEADGNFIALSQPSSSEQKKILPYLLAWVAAILALCIVIPILGENDEKNRVAIIVLSSVLSALILAGIALCVWFRLYLLPKKEREFYAENMPFDLSDISHLSLRKSVKEQLQRDLNKEREERPHSYNDFGNGFDVTFGNDGVTLKTPEEMFEEENFGGEDRNSVPASEIFEGISDVTEMNKGTGLFLPYGELNFEAVAFYRKTDHPMTIIVKSRLQSSADFPEFFENDLHLVFDANLQKTFETFEVEAENLHYLLENKSTLMEAYCKNRKKEN